MMRAAIIQNGKVQNVIELDSLIDLPGAVACPDNDIGDSFDGQGFTKAIVAQPIPTVVEMYQARAALIKAGLFDTVNNALIAMPGLDGQLARNEWEFSPTLKRDHPLVSTLSAEIGLTSAQLDSLFSSAAQL